MTATRTDITPESTMQEVLDIFPGAQRALFRQYHIGGCSHCAFQPTETLQQVCERNNQLDVHEVIEHIRQSHEEDARILMEPQELQELLNQNPNLKLVDVRAREEFEAVHLPNAQLLSQPLMQEIMTSWPTEELFVIIDHQGKQSLDAAAYFLGHGYKNVRCLRGGIDAWSREVDSSVPRYEIA